jgi:membrane-bound lytic murein transglycosylase B
VSRVLWLRALAVVAATAIVLAASCSWQLGVPIPDGVPPPAGDPVPAVDTHALGRPAEQLRTWAERHAATLNMPVVALESYGYAARVAQVENFKCHLAWTTLAGIGQVESHHGTYGGAAIAPNGDVSPPIRGVRLDGTNGNMEIVADDSIQPDPDPDYARAMGPMQFIPETWRLYGVSARGNTAASPDNFDDAALSAAGYLCWTGKDLATPRGWMNALRAYNHSDQYARTVRDWATAYAAGHPL